VYEVTHGDGALATLVATALLIILYVARYRSKVKNQNAAAAKA
jgi:hypothetical protein